MAKNIKPIPSYLVFGLGRSTDIINIKKEDVMKKNDTTTTIDELKKISKQFVSERDWEQFHNPKNIAIDISVEANELLEKFIWMNGQESFKEIKTNKQDIEDELADVLFGVLAFCNSANLDITTAFHKKMEQNNAKYPIAKSKGKWTKYNKL